MKLTTKDILKSINWTEFNKFIKDKDPNVFISNLKLLEKTLKNLDEKVSQQKDKVEKENVECMNCKKYFKYPDKEKVFQESVIRKGVTVYTDAGYGDNDEIADVKFTYAYCSCPLCGKKTRISNDYVDRTEISGTRHKRCW